MNITSKIENLIKKLSSNLQERDEAIKLSLLALLSGESIFLLGPPGVAKSLLSRKIKEALLDAKEFEYLMNRFSTPEEIFGPISLIKLEQDKYERKIEGYLPDSEIVFLDEIWKASPSIQNTLLTVINERIFKNGTNTLQVPLKLLIGASNELPAQGEGLEALYDRFLIRLFVNNVTDKKMFRTLIDNTSIQNDLITDEEKLTSKDLETIRKNASKIVLDDTSFNFISQIKEKLTTELKEAAPYVSDRRWKKIVSIIKTSAYVSGRDQISLGDLLLVQNLIWETPDQFEQIRKIVLDCWINAAVSSTGFTIDDAKESLKQIEESYNKSYSKKVVPFKIIKDEYNIDHKIFWTQDDNEFKFWAFPTSGVSYSYAYIYLWKTINPESLGKINQNNSGSEYSDRRKFFFSELPEIKNKQEFTWRDKKFQIYNIEQEEIDAGKLENVEKSLAPIAKILSKLSDKKDDIIKNMKHTKNLLVNSYEYNIDYFDSKLDELINEYSRAKDDLMYKIKASLDWARKK